MFTGGELLDHSPFLYLMSRLSFTAYGCFLMDLVDLRLKVDAPIQFQVRY